MEKLILIKLGGSVITDKSKPFTARKNVIVRLAGEIHSARKKTNALLILGHGGGSYPHVPAAKYMTVQGIVNSKSYKGITKVQDAAARLNRLVVKKLITAGENAISINPSSIVVTYNNEIKKAYLKPLKKVLEFKMLPIVYGDVCLDEKIGCTIISTEKILTYLAISLKDRYSIGKIIICGNTDGVYDSEGKTIDKITPDWFLKNKGVIGGSQSTDVTGGMRHKVEECLKMSKRNGVQSLVINGNVVGNLKKAILGEKVLGTVIG